VARRGAREVARRRDFENDARTPEYIEPVRRSRDQRPAEQAAWVRVDDTHRTRTHRTKDSPAPATAGARAEARARPGAPGTYSSASATAALARLAGRKTLPADVATAIRNAADAATQRHKELLVEKTEDAYRAYERGRYQDAHRAIKQVADEVPAVPAVRELAGFAAYRSGRWRDAARHLQALGALTDSTEYLPVLMDCQRALHKPKKVAELWTELRQSSPEPDVLAEGRIVAAASLADAGDLTGAIALLADAGASKSLRNPSARHVRQWYLLADLYERAGDVPRAREFFERVRRADPAAYDVDERLRGLGPERRPRPRSRKKQPAGPAAEASAKAPAKTKPKKAPGPGPRPRSPR
jgi:tetratricopeptide (TPR) repeat protein